MSTLPALNSASTALTSAGLRRRETHSSMNGRSARRSRKVPKCCWARIVVGASIITCLPSEAALTAARSATSVLPKPTSPQTRRSIGCSDSMSPLTASIASIWSAVSR